MKTVKTKQMIGNTLEYKDVEVPAVEVTTQFGTEYLSAAEAFDQCFIWLDHEPNKRELLLATTCFEDFFAARHGRTINTEFVKEEAEYIRCVKTYEQYKREEQELVDAQEWFGLQTDDVRKHVSVLLKNSFKPACG